MWLLFLVIILMMIVCDTNYFVRTYFTVLSSRLCNDKKTIDEVTTIYGECLAKLQIFYSTLYSSTLHRYVATLPSNVNIINYLG